MKIAIDGPSGAGKSTAAKLLAKRLNMVYLDTGAMYRAAALYAYCNGVAFTAEDIAPILPKINIDIKYGENAGGQTVYLNGEDVSADIRKHFVSKLASDISALPPVRLFLVDLQRQLAAQNGARGVILDGRDVGTFVLPDAEFKFYLTASVDERACRRFLELTQKGEVCDIERLKEDIERRDYNDMSRALAPLKKAADAIEIDSTYMGIDQVVEFMAEVISAQ